MIFQDIIQAINRSEKIAILSHVSPDGDNIGSSLGLCHALQSIGKKATFILDDEVPKTYKFLKGADSVQKPGNAESYDLVMALDGGDENRFGKSGMYMQGSYVINIDHHISNKGFGDISLVDPEAAATGELIYHLVKLMNIPIGKDIAECLYTAIVTDTGRFQYSNTTARTHLIASELIECGISVSLLSEKIYQSESKGKVLLTKKALESLEFHANDRIASIHLFKTDIESLGASDAECENLINYARDIDQVEVAVFLREKGDGIVKLSLRSKKLVDVSKIAQSFGGGGHMRASGATVTGEVFELREKVIAEIMKQLI